MIEKITTELINAIKRAAQLLTGATRRRYQAEIAEEYLDGSSRRAERTFGWSRETVAKGLGELRSGIDCLDNFSARGNKCTEDKNPQLLADIEELVAPTSQADPSFKSPFGYTRITAKKLHELLISEKNWREEELPSLNALRNILNRMGYRLRRVQKTEPLKKIEETDAIFENVHALNAAADADPETLRISIDVKAKVDIGNFSRDGRVRSQTAPKASDHDMGVELKLVPVGLLEVVSGKSTIVFGNSKETSDLIVDSLEWWWEQNQGLLSGIKKLAINSDNGPHVQSNRLLFINRLIDFSDRTGLAIHLIYYPPYHSKYNPVERVWGILENHWNGAILNSVDNALKWAETMTWKGIHPVVNLLDKVYESGKKLTDQQKNQIAGRFERNPLLPKWDVIIPCGTG